VAFIEKLELSYKSIEAATLQTKRVNVFVGEPNTGKSNLLEALALLSVGAAAHVQRITRTQQVADLFYDHEISNSIGLTINGNFGWTLTFDKQRSHFELGINKPDKPPVTAHLPPSLNPNQWPQYPDSPLRYYIFRHLPERVTGRQYGFLEPPYGDNLALLLYSNKRFRESVSSIFRSKGFRLEVRPHESEILVSKEVDDVLYSYRFQSISETLQRIVFYKAILETNEHAILILDEPEANTFPFYTKYLAERIALENSNQFFLTTHNPYVLMSIIEKTPRQDLAVFVTRMNNYRTEFSLVDEKGLSEMLDLSMDVFLNLERFFPD
jgi:hypothetical protein